MEKNHSPEPWSVESTENGVPLQILASPTEKDPDYNPVTRTRTTFVFPSSPQARANAARIVECVNACEGINPAAVPLMLDALRSAAVALYVSNPTEGEKGVELTALSIAREAIAKATGEEKMNVPPSN